jgi:hypothetical protein
MGLPVVHEDADMENNIPARELSPARSNTGSLEVRANIPRSVRRSVRERKGKTAHSKSPVEVSATRKASKKAAKTPAKTPAKKSARESAINEYRAKEAAKKEAIKRKAEATRAARKAEEEAKAAEASRIAQQKRDELAIGRARRAMARGALSNAQHKEAQEILAKEHKSKADIDNLMAMMEGIGF